MKKSHSSVPPFNITVVELISGYKSHKSHKSPQLLLNSHINVFPKPDNFCVYTTVPVDLDFVDQTLNEGQLNKFPPSQTQFAACPD